MKDLINYYLNWNFIFNGNFNNNILIILLVFFSCLLLIGLGFAIYFKQQAKNIAPYKLYSEKIFNYTMWISLTGLLYTFFSWQQIPYLSIPLLLIIIKLLLIYFIIRLVLDTKKLKTEIDKFNQEKKYNQYLPKKKQSK